MNKLNRFSHLLDSQLPEKSNLPNVEASRFTGLNPIPRLKRGPAPIERNLDVFENDIHMAVDSCIPWVPDHEPDKCLQELTALEPPQPAV